MNVLRKLNDFDKLTVGRETSELQTLCSELLTVGVVELVTMTVTLVDKTLAVKLAGDGIFVKLAGYRPRRIVPPMSTPFWSGMMSITSYLC